MAQSLQQTHNKFIKRITTLRHYKIRCAAFLSTALAAFLLILLPQVSYAQLTQQWKASLGPSGAGLHNNIISSKIDHEGNLLVLAAGDNGVAGSPATKVMIYKLDAAGNKLWQVERGIGGARPIELELDDDNNVYVLVQLLGGAGGALFKFSQEGKELWANIMAGAVTDITSVADLLVVGDEVYLASNGTKNNVSFSLLSKLNTQGEVLWEQRQEGATAYKLAADGQQNIVLAGAKEVYLPNQPEYSNVLLLNYMASNGSLVFEKNYDYINSGLSGSDYPVALNVSQQGEILVISNSTPSPWNPNVYNVVLMKTDREGNVQWQTTMSNTNESFYRDAALAPDGSVVLIATEIKYRHPPNYSIAKISGEGERLWFKTLNSVSGNTDREFYRVGDTINVVEPVSVAVDKAGHIAITTVSDRKVMGWGGLWIWVYQEQPTLVSRLYSQEGEQLWEDAVKAEPGHATFGSDVVFDASDNLYVLGTETNHEAEVWPQPTYRDAFVIKYSPQQVCNMPVDVKLYLPPYAMKVGEQVRTTADFGDHILNEDTGVRWAWGDNTAPSMSFTAFGTPRITGWHRYEEAGIYTIGLDASESCLKPTSEDYTQEMVIFDPAAGNASGAGLFHSPVGQLDMMQTAGTSAFAFAARYTNSGAHAKPSGAALLLLNSRNVLFSNSLDWLVIKGGRAALQGTGTVNGKGRYRFVATMEDGKGAGLNDASDMMRLQVWDMDAHGKLVYDNAAGTEQRLSLTQPLPDIGGGQILINHKQLDPLFAVYLQQALEGSTPLTDVVAYPNPFTSKTTIGFSLEQGGDYSVDLYDLKGTLIRRIGQGVAASKANVSVEVDGTGLAQGIYLARLQTGNSVQTVKLVLDK